MAPPKKKATAGKRRAIAEVERHRVWVAAGGRCTVCRKYLLEGALSKLPFRLGELAHIVGQQDSDASPRGTAEVMSHADRDRAENLMLVCAGEHQEIDRQGAVELFTVEDLRSRKARNEDWIRHVTGLSPEDTTAVVRLLGDVRGNAVELDRATAAAAVIRGDERWPDFPLAFARDGVEVDLRGLPGENPVQDGYWTTATAMIDRDVARLAEGVRDGRVVHVSVFAFARLPLLVHLGSRLDDAYGVTVYQRHRSTQGWDWPAGGVDVAFRTVPPAVADNREDAVFLVNVSGTVQPGELPQPLRSLPRYLLEPVGVTPHPDVVATPASLRSFEVAVRSLLADVEARHKHLRRLHLVAAAPVSACVVLGRTRDPHVHPAFTVYDRTDNTYTPALEIA
ncbi:MAG: SAVED domain-containing protein [Actinomycetota bacterium]|nr:SAVED domain-containing protein [Actinomycetota bacterium]